MGAEVSKEVLVEMNEGICYYSCISIGILDLSALYG